MLVHFHEFDYQGWLCYVVGHCFKIFTGSGSFYGITKQGKHLVGYKVIFMVEDSFALHRVQIE